MDEPLFHVEQHPDGFVAYLLGMTRGAAVGQGDTAEAALMDARSALAFHLAVFGTL